MRATSALKREAGSATSSWSAWRPLRICVSRSAIGSLTAIGSPAGLGQARDVALVRLLAQADAAQAELAEVRARPPAAAAAVVLACLELLRALGAHHLRRLRHLTPTAPRCPRRVRRAGRPRRRRRPAARRGARYPGRWRPPPPPRCPGAPPRPAQR